MTKKPPAVDAERQELQNKFEQKAREAEQDNVKAVGKSADKVIVYIETSEASDGHQPVTLGFGGRMMLVERGKWSEIPKGYFESLKDAVEDRFEPLKDGGMSAPRQVQRFPYRVWTDAGDPPDLQRPPQFFNDVRQEAAKMDQRAA